MRALHSFRRRPALAVAAALVMLSFPGVARAQGDKAGAEALLDEGVKLAGAKDYARACPKLEESLHLYASLNTEYFLADCYEHAGKMATAWIDFLEVAERAQAAGEKGKEDKARERASLIAGRVSRLEIHVTEEALAGLKVERDGVEVGRGQWDVAMPVDGGEHVVVASAPGRATLTLRTTVKPEGDHATLTVPVLETVTPPSAPAASAAPPVPAESPAPPAPALRPAPVAAPAPPVRSPVGLIVGGIGGAGLVVGAVAGLVASSKWSSAKKECTSVATCGAGSQALGDHDGAETAATVSTVAFVAGAAALAGGAVLFLTSGSAGSRPSDERAPASLLVSPTFGLGSAGLSLWGQF